MATINDDCNFCGAKYSDSNKKITRNNVSVCEECVKLIDEMRSPTKTCDEVEEDTTRHDCVKCGEEFSCGNKNENGEWMCEDCYEHCDEEEEEDEMEDCEWCGYTHHSEDKCPNDKTAEHFVKWRNAPK